MGRHVLVWDAPNIDESLATIIDDRPTASDSDPDMIDHLGDRHAEGDLDVVYVGSNDAKQFVDPLLELVAAGVEVNVLGFSELAGELAQARELRFIDLETIEDLFEVPLPRITLEALPAEDRWFEPIGVLGGSSHLA